VAEGSGEDADEDVAAFWGWDGDLFYYEGFAVLGLLVEVSFSFFFEGCELGFLGRPVMDGNLMLFQKARKITSMDDTSFKTAAFIIFGAILTSVLFLALEWFTVDLSLL
jgi:hypothetical protein